MARAHLTELRTAETGWSKAVKKEGRVAGRKSAVCVVSAGRCDFTCGQIAVALGNGHMQDSHGKKYLIQRAELSTLIFPKFLICVNQYCIGANPKRGKGCWLSLFPLFHFGGKLKTVSVKKLSLG